MHKASIIGVSGQAGSGKDTVAEHLIRSHGFTRVALADPIKRFGYHVFLFSEQQLWGSSSYRNAFDRRYEKQEAWDEAQGRLEAWGRQYCSNVLGTDDPDELNKAYKALVRWFFWLQANHRKLSPRIMLQTLGTEWGREAISNDIWINALLTTAKTLLHEDGGTKLWDYDPLIGPNLTTKHTIKGVVVSDIRFQNEFDAIHREGGNVIRIIRPDTDADAADIGIAGHASEAQEFPLDTFDFLIQNDKALCELYDNVDTFMSMFYVTHH